MSAVARQQDVSLESLAAQVADEFLARQKRGEQPEVEEYAARYPQFAREIREVLTALRVLDLSAPSEASLADGEAPSGVLGDYRIIREVGRGGMAVVYEAEQLSLGRRVALKVLPFAATMDSRQLQRFHNEARAAAGLHHTNIVPVFGVGCERGVHYYAMQFIDGRTLADFIAEQQGGPPSRPATGRAESQAAAGSAPTVPAAAQATSVAPRDAAYFSHVAEWGIQAAEALDCAHSLGVVHRDVKPANLLVDDTGRLWITDFGLAQVQSDTRLTMTGDLVGTLRYMSPEQALAKRVVIDHRTDVYSLGATLYELLTLRPVFAGTDRQELLRQIAFDEPIRPRRLNRAIPLELETIALKAMEKNTQDRYATAKELADDLRRYLDDKPIQARRPSWRHVARKWARRHRPVVWSAAVTVIVTLAVLGGSVGWVLRDRAALQAEAEVPVVAAIDEAERELAGGKVHEAFSAALRAEGLLVQAGGGHPRLSPYVLQLVKDLRMRVTLEDIRLTEITVKDDLLDGSVPDLAYAKAFKDYGIDVENLPRETAVALIRESRIRMDIVAALDAWAWTRQGSRREEGRKDLLAVARASDPDQVRVRLREQLEGTDRGVIAEMVRLENADALSASVLTMVAMVSVKKNDNLAPLVPYLRRAQQRQPDDFWLNHFLAVALINVRPPQRDDAIGYYRVAVGLAPRSAAARVNLGQALYDSDRSEEAMAELRESLRLKPDYAAAHNQLGNVLMKMDRLDEAMERYREAIRLKKDAAEPHFNLGQILLRKGHSDEAISEYREAVRLKPGFILARKNLGITLREKGRLDEAVAQLREVTRLAPNDAHAHYNLALTLQDKRELDKAIVALREAVGLAPNDAQMHHNLGVALRDRGELDDAMAEFREAIRLTPKEALPHHNLGIVLRDKGELDNAMAEFREAIRLKPDLAVAHLRLADGLRAKGWRDQAIIEYREALRLDPNDAGAHMNFGNLLMDMGHLAEAVAELREAIRLNKDDAVGHHNLGNALSRTGKKDDAIDEYREAVRLNKNFFLAHGALGHALMQKGRVDDAIEEFRELVRLRPDDAWAHYDLGNGFLAQNSLAAAVGAFQEAIRHNPNFAQAHCNLGHARRRQGHFVEALAQLKRGHELGSKDSRWHYPSGAWVQEAEQLVAQEVKLHAYQKGEYQPQGNADRLALVAACQGKMFYLAAARLCADAFAADPKVAADLQAQHRYNAACFAALAAAGEGKDAEQLDENERVHWRKQALDWLRADLALWAKRLDGGTAGDRAAVAKMLRHWQQDTDFAGVRGEVAIARLPEPERRQWQKLWAEIADLLARAEAKAAAAKESATQETAARAGGRKKGGR
jgi:tetratricopeptide (TPR) repeat protein